jgi:hypothetical protein
MMAGAPKPISRLRSVPKHAAQAVLLLCAAAVPARGQPTAPPVAHVASLAGPRFGITALSQGVVDTLKIDEGISLAPVVTQFGWQFEKQFYGNKTGPTAITEAVVLVGGLEQGIAIPSLSWLVGVRTPEGLEFGVGPNITPVGVALALAAGTTFRAGILNIPVNVAVVPSRAGMRVSLLTGFSLRHF